jgi:hypothetical protein
MLVKCAIRTVHCHIKGRAECGIHYLIHNEERRKACICLSLKNRFQMAHLLLADRHRSTSTYMSDDPPTVSPAPLVSPSVVAECPWCLHFHFTFQSRLPSQGALHSPPSPSQWLCPSTPSSAVARRHLSQVQTPPRSSVPEAIRG